MIRFFLSYKKGFKVVDTSYLVVMLIIEFEFYLIKDFDYVP